MSYTIQKGHQGLAVFKIQQYLNDLIKIYPTLKKIDETGIFDCNTEFAIKTFQNLTGLIPNGILDSLTWDKIIEKVKSLENPVIPNKTSYMIKINDEGLDVFKLQGYLNQLFPNNKPLKLDGKFGIKTESRVILFQMQYDLSATGIVDEQAWNRLIDAL